MNFRDDPENVIDDMVPPWGARRSDHDNSFNTETWGNPANRADRGAAVVAGTTSVVDPVAQANAEVERAFQAVCQAEEALYTAQTALKRAQGRALVAAEAPTWRQIFSPVTRITANDVYTYCMQTGYKWAVWEYKLYKIGSPAEQLIDTGLTAEDIK